MKRLWLAVACATALLLMLPMVFATEISTAETTIVMEEGSVSILTKIAVEVKETVGNLTLVLAPKSTGVEVKIDGQERKCSLIKSEFARCGSLEVGNHGVEYAYETSYPIARVGENTLFRYTNSLPYSAREHNIVLELPVGFIIPREKGKDESFYTNPKPDDVYSDGQRIILSWKKADAQEVGITVVSREVLNTPTWIFFVSGIIVLVFIGALVYTVRIKKKYVKPRQPKPRKQEKTLVIPELMESEQKIVDLLKAKGPLWQKQIQLETKFSKAKVSRVVRNLEARGVVKKVPYGNTNKIFLKPK